MRKYGKATRDTLEGKPEYVKYLSPIVLKSFGEYMLKHQTQSNGEKREGDNWKNLFGKNHKDICLDSAFRHFMDLWLLHDGFEAREDIDEAINGILFNIMAIQHARITRNNRTK